ncbi:hypothetical protein ACH347_12445 [Saccharopolyspora sp. 5N102]|uniref:hypothetical protein n=1 Tax=Saccharopolyspora sp. 5N102 TaxID=3375155 RepID=UPI0037B129AC
MHELELSSQSVELLPTREALGGNFGTGDIITITQLNIVVAVNIGDDIAQDIEASNVADVDFN